MGFQGGYSLKVETDCLICALSRYRLPIFLPPAGWISDRRPRPLARRVWQSESRQGSLNRALHARARGGGLIACKLTAWTCPPPRTQNRNGFPPPPPNIGAQGRPQASKMAPPNRMLSWAQRLQKKGDDAGLVPDLGDLRYFPTRSRARARDRHVINVFFSVEPLGSGNSFARAYRHFPPNVSKNTNPL